MLEAFDVHGSKHPAAKFVLFVKMAKRTPYHSLASRQSVYERTLNDSKKIPENTDNS